MKKKRLNGTLCNRTIQAFCPWFSIVRLKSVLFNLWPFVCFDLLWEHWQSALLQGCLFVCLFVVGFLLLVFCLFVCFVVVVCCFFVCLSVFCFGLVFLESFNQKYDNESYCKSYLRNKHENVTKVIYDRYIFLYMRAQRDSDRNGVKQTEILNTFLKLYMTLHW